MKKFYLFLLTLLCTIGAWATPTTTDWIDYSTSFSSQLTSERPSLSVSIDDYPTLTLARTEGTGNIAWATVSSYKRPWLRGGNKFTISVAGGKIVGYEIVTRGMAASGVTFAPFQFGHGMEGSLQSSEMQQKDADKTISVDSYDANSIVLDLTAWTPTGNQGLVITGLRLKLQYEWVQVTINAHEGDAGTPSFSATLPMLTGENLHIATALPATELLEYEDKIVNITSAESQTIDVKYTEKIPFATTYGGLVSGNKWFSMYTLNGRMHVRDTDADGNEVAKYPTIDKATFTRLNDNYFWGFICENPLTSAVVKIANKAAGSDQTLYLTSNGDNVPVLLATEASKGANWVTNEWILEKSTKATATATGDKYYGIRAQGTNKYINNYANQGFMTTWHDGQNQDDGSNHKFIGELETYDILKERALKAPCNAVHSLNAAARQAIKDNTDNTVAAYQAVIAEINQTTGSETGYIDFDETKYYVLRNYTPEGGNVYVLGSDNGTGSRTFTVPADQAGDADNVMTYSNINAIWKIEKNGEAAGGDGLGASRTTPRRLSHVNSAKMLSAITNRSLVEAASAANYYFIDLGAGQHFLKNVQYTGTGNQAKAKPLSCADNGTLQVGGDRHLKNSRDTWYGIPVSDIKVAIGAAGYASLYLPFGVDLPADEDLEAYAVTGTTAATATLTGVTSVPANQGVILKGTAGKTYSLTINDAAAWDIADNKLRGSNMHENVTDAAYVLSMPSGATEAGFYKAAMTGGSWLNNDNKAYLPASAIPAGAPSLSFVFDTETGIEGVGAATAGKNAIYDLSGRRVKSAQKGIYIINGKKVVK